MDQWIDFYDSAHTIYVSDRHRDVHFRLIAADILRYVPSPEAVVLDYSCGDALGAPIIAAGCEQLILAEPAPGIRERLRLRFRDDPKMSVQSLDDLQQLPDASIDLAVINSVAQYMTPAELDGAFRLLHRAIKPEGLIVLGDILDPKVGALTDVTALLRLAARNGFLIDAVIGLVRTALSDYRTLRARLGLQHYDEATMLAKLANAGFSALRAKGNIGHNPSRMTFVATRGR